MEEIKQINYQDIRNSYLENPRDVHTCPMNKKKPLWFHVMVKGETVYVGPASTHTPSSSITAWRSLNMKECDKMIDFYHRRMRGEFVSVEAKAVTRNQVYWYGILNDLGL